MLKFQVYARASFGYRSPSPSMSSFHVEMGAFFIFVKPLLYLKYSKMPFCNKNIHLGSQRLFLQNL